MRRIPGWRVPSSDFQAARDDFQTLPLYVDIDLTTARSVALGTQLTLPLSGNFLYVDQKPNSGFASCIFQDDTPVGGAPIALFPGFIARNTFTRLTIENVAQPATIMRLIYGVDIDFHPAGVSGLVTVINGETARVLAGLAYLGSVVVGPVAAQFSGVQIFNPAASGRRAWVSDVWLWASAAGLIAFRRYDTQLTTLGALRNKLVGGGAVSSMEIRSESNVAELGTFMASYFTPAGQSVQVPFAEPVCVLPGSGFLVQSRVVNIQVNIGFNLYEESI